MPPNTGHTLNLAEPLLVNLHRAEFLAMVEAGRWMPRDPRADPAEVMPAEVMPAEVMKLS